MSGLMYFFENVNKFVFSFFLIVLVSILNATALQNTEVEKVKKEVQQLNLQENHESLKQQHIGRNNFSIVSWACAFLII